MKTLRHGARARVAAVGIAAGVLLAGCGAANESAPAGGSRAERERRRALSGTISGAGSTAQQAAMQAWIAGFPARTPTPPSTTTPQGSGAGRTQFLSGGVAVRRLRRATSRRDELTKAAGALQGRRRRGPGLRLADRGGLQPAGRRRDLQLAPATIADIFAGKITNWNDPAIAADNPGETLPDLAITPVHRSDESGTTAELHRLPEQGRARRLDLPGRPAPGRSRAARPRRAPRASSARSRAATARSATPTRARPAASARR